MCAEVPGNVVTLAIYKGTPVLCFWISFIGLCIYTFVYAHMHTFKKVYVWVWGWA